MGTGADWLAGAGEAGRTTRATGGADRKSVDRGIGNGRVGNTGFTGGTGDMGIMGEPGLIGEMGVMGVPGNVGGR